jgi:hypothetical protein
MNGGRLSNVSAKKYFLSLINYFDEIIMLHLHLTLMVARTINYICMAKLRR